MATMWKELIGLSDLVKLGLISQAEKEDFEVKEGSHKTVPALNERETIYGKLTFWDKIRR